MQKNLLSEEELAKVREFFKMDRYASVATGIEIEEVAQDYAKVSLVRNVNHQNAVNQVMGAVYYTLADFVFAVAVNHDIPLGKKDAPVIVTLNSQISFLSACKGGKMFATAEKIKEGGSTVFYQVNISDDQNTDIARIVTTGYKIYKKEK